MGQASHTQLLNIDYKSFISYFESDYMNELATMSTFEVRYEFLKTAYKIAKQHKELFELRHGPGSYKVNLARYGNLRRTPLQIILGDFNMTHLLMPKLSGTYACLFGRNTFHFKHGEKTKWSEVLP